VLIDGALDLGIKRVLLGEELLCPLLVFGLHRVPLGGQVGQFFAILLKGCVRLVAHGDHGECLKTLTQNADVPRELLDCFPGIDPDCALFLHGRQGLALGRLEYKLVVGVLGRRGHAGQVQRFGRRIGRGLRLGFGCFGHLLSFHGSEVQQNGARWQVSGPWPSFIRNEQMVLPLRSHTSNVARPFSTRPNSRVCGERRGESS
jgi:hypothetical protein